ncbi:MAG: glycosyltransferase [Chthoniobacterales bacterium]
MTSPLITVGVPVYRGARYLAETLESIRVQTCGDLRVLISIDGPDPESEAVCQPFLRDKRFSVVTQPERLGWVGNIDWLTAQVDTPFWCYYQQDDLTAPCYFEKLLEAALCHLSAAVVYCDIVAFGTQSWQTSQPSVTGIPAARQLALLYAHHSAVAFRGLTRVEALRESGGLITNEVENYSVDTTWMSQMACWGDLIRVPGDWYFKRYHEDNVHTKWADWPEEKRLHAWIAHCADLLEITFKVGANPQERRLLWLATVNRLTSPRVAPGYLQMKEITQEQRMALLENFLHYLQKVRCSKLPYKMKSTWDDLALWTRGFFSRPPGLVEKRPAA